MNLLAYHLEGRSAGEQALALAAWRVIERVLKAQPGVLPRRLEQELHAYAKRVHVRPTLRALRAGSAEYFVNHAVDEGGYPKTWCPESYEKQFKDWSDVLERDRNSKGWSQKDWQKHFDALKKREPVKSAWDVAAEMMGRPKHEVKTLYYAGNSKKSPKRRKLQN